LRHSLIVLGLLFISSNLFAGTAVFFDVGTNKVTRYITRGYNEEATSPGILINPDLSALLGIVPQKYWKHESGFIVSMTQIEIDTEVQARFQASSDTIRTNSKLTLYRFNNRDLLLRALADVIKDEINLLRTLHGMPDRTLKQLKTAIKNKIDSGEAD